jgi:hypothetical protein
MSRQRKRHADRQPLEETVRLSLAELVGSAGSVDAERHSYDWREDDLLMWVRLKEPISGSVLAVFRRGLADRMRLLLPPGQPLSEWLVVVECNGQTLGTVAWHDRAGQSEEECT